MKAFLLGIGFWLASCGVAFGYSGPVFYDVVDGVVYYHNSMGMRTAIAGADPATFKAVSTGRAEPFGRFEIYATDKNHVYYYTEILPGVSPKGFAFVPDTHGLVKNDEHVYYEDSGRHVVLEGMDPASVVALSPKLLRDNRFAYYQKAPNQAPARIDGAQAHGFEVLWGTRYVKDARRVFYLPSDDADTYLAIEKADPKTFRVDDPDSAYARDDSHVFFNGTAVAGADPGTFRRYLASEYNMDARRVYFYNRPINGAEPADFEILGDGYARDARALFFQDREVPEADLRSLEFGYYGFARDARHAYYNGEIIKGADMASFEVVSYYAAEFKDKNRTYVGAKPGTHRPNVRRYEIEGENVYIFYSPSAGRDRIYEADAKSFEPIDDFYSRDKRNVFAGRDKIAGADRKTFKRLQGDFGEDKRRIYFSHKPIAGADKKTFRILGVQYSRDKKHVFFRDAPIAGADPESFAMLGYPYSRDSRFVYYQDKRIEGADPESLKQLRDGAYARDGRNVYFKGKRIEGADPGTFKRYWDLDLYVDKRALFHRGAEIENSDAASFRAWGYYWQQDKNQVYYRNKPLPEIDAATFQRVNSIYGKDRNHVYVEGAILKDADPESFSILSRNSGKDKNAYFHGGRKIEKAEYTR